MMHGLRHATGRLWITLLVGAGSSLWLLTVLRPAISIEAAPAVVAVWMLFLFFAVGWAANRLGLRQVRRLLQAADQAAREGLIVEAEALFHKGLALLDSFLVSPGARRRSLTTLSARLARFYLARPGGWGSSEAFIPRYLAENPGDREVAEQWVLALEGRDGESADHQWLLARLAAAHPRHDPLQLALARSYLAQERTDFAALQCYRRVCAGEAPLQPEVCRAVAALLREAGHGDEWARQIVRRFMGAPPAADESALPSSALQPQAQEQEPADSGADGAGDDGAFRMNPSLDETEEEAEEHPGLGVGAAAFWGRLSSFAATVYAVAANGLGRAARRVAAVRAATWGWAGAAGLGILVAAAGVWLWVGDADLFRESVEPPAAVNTQAGPAPMVTDRFTLQVAAYLKAEYAHAFVERLKSQGFDAYWTQTASGGKIWYQVRIAHFPDRPSAREFGSRLKQKGVIEDFYVTNYSR